MTGRGAGKLPAQRVSHNKSIEAAFERQRKRRICAICRQEVLVCLYATHINSCNLADNDSDVEVVEVLTGEQSRALKAGPAIVIEEEDPIDLPVDVDGAEHSDKDVEEDQKEKSADVPVANSSDAVRTLRPRTPKLQVAVPQSANKKGHRKTKTVTKVKEEDGQENEMPAEKDGEEEGVKGPGIPYPKYIRKMVKSLVGSGFDKNFWADDWKMVCRIMKLSPEALELLMRMFLRQPTWFREKNLAEKYDHLKAAMRQTMEELLKTDFLEDGNGTMNQEDLFAVCDLSSMKKIAKLYHLDITQTKQQLTEAFSKLLRTQKDIFGRSKGVASEMYKTFHKEIGRTVKVNETVRTLLMCILTLSCPTETNSAHIYDLQTNNIYPTFLVTVHDVETGRLRLPAPTSYKECHVISIYRSFLELKQYIRAKELEVKAFLASRTATIGEIGGFVTQTKQILSQCDLQYFAALPPCLRRFSPPLVLVRCIAIAATAYEKAKQHALAVELQRYLLHSQELIPFGGDLRGSWWERLTLNLEVHLKEVEEAKEELAKAFGDVAVADKDMLALEDRYVKIFKEKGPCRVVNTLSTPKCVTIEGMVLDKELGDGRINRFVEVSEDGQMTAVSVENVAKSHYTNNVGFQYGVHAEGSIWHTVMGILFYDQIYDHSHAQAYMSTYQRVPTDLNYPEFHNNRMEVIEGRLKWLREDASDAELLTEMTHTWRDVHGIETSKIVWDLFESPEAIHEFIKSVGRKPLAEIFHFLLTDHRNTRSGFPDLTLWDPVKKKCMAVEVKGPGDRLSTKQRIWLHRMNKAGMEAEVCHVKAKAARALSTRH